MTLATWYSCRMWVGGCLASYKGRFGDSGPGLPGLSQSVLDWGASSLWNTIPLCCFLWICDLMALPRRYTTQIPTSKLSQANGWTSSWTRSMDHIPVWWRQGNVTTKLAPFYVVVRWLEIFVWYGSVMYNEVGIVLHTHTHTHTYHTHTHTHTHTTHTHTTHAHTHVHTHTHTHMHTHMHTHTPHFKHPPPLKHPFLPHSSFALLDATTDMLLSLLMLLYAIVHAYRAAYLMAVYVTLTAIKQVVLAKWFGFVQEL